MAYCDQCGTQIDEGARFCRNCGKPLQPTGPERQNTENIETSVKGPGKENKRNLPLIATVAAIVLVCFGVGACFGLNVGGVREYPAKRRPPLRQSGCPRGGLIFAANCLNKAAAPRPDKAPDGTPL